MYINSIQSYNYTNTNFNNINNKTNYVYHKNLIRDKFEKEKFSNQIQFKGLLSYNDLIIKFLKNKTYKTSILGSKRPLFSIDKDLKDVIAEVKIKVSPNEEIFAWDMNPKKSKQYVIFLHGFSQNITSNQSLYKGITESKYGLLAIDYRGYGKNPNSKNITEENILQDIQASVNYLKDKGIKDIGLIGHSFGGYMASKISKNRDFNFQILVSPMTSLEFWLKNVLKHPTKYKRERFLIKYIPNFSKQYNKIFNIKENLKNNLTPTYVIQAKRDRYIRTNKLNSVVKEIPNLQRYTILSTGGHKMDTSKIEEIKMTLNKL